MDLLTPSSSGNFPTLSLITNSSWLPWRRVVMPLISPLIPVPLSFWCGYACQMLLYITDSCCSCYFYLLVLKIRQKQRIFDSCCSWLNQWMLDLFSRTSAQSAAVHSAWCSWTAGLDGHSPSEFTNVMCVCLHCLKYRYQTWYFHGTELSMGVHTPPQRAGTQESWFVLCCSVFVLMLFDIRISNFATPEGIGLKGSPCLDYLALFQWHALQRVPS